MQTVHLNGNIAQFGVVWHTNCFNIRDVFKLIECQTPGFRKHIVDAAEAGVEYEIKRGGEFLDYQEELLISLNDDDVIITEVPAGSKSGGAKILAAIIITYLTWGAGSGVGGLGTTTGQGAVTGSSIYTGAIPTQFQTVVTGLNTGGVMAMGIATNLAMTGLAQIMAPGPEVDKNTDESYLFDGPTNAITQGFPVPLAYGELIVGGAPISQSYRPIGGSTGQRLADKSSGGGTYFDSSGDPNDLPDSAPEQDYDYH